MAPMRCLGTVHLRSTMMKTFVTLAIIATLGLLAEANLSGLKPRNVVVPADPKHTVKEWLDIMAAQTQIPEQVSGLKNGTNPQPDFAGKVQVPESDARITGGYTASRGQFPWQVALFIDNSFYCGGSLLSERWVLTAAHCAGSTYEVRLGANRLDIKESGSLDTWSRNSFVHSGYDPNIIRNDIAVVLLPQSVQFTIYINPVRLPTRSQQGNSFAGQTLRASGWGKISDSVPGITSQLQYVDLIAITNYECARTFGNAIYSSNLCVSTYGGQSTCNGDSGGPLVYREYDGRYTQVGIVSFGSTLGCQRGYPAAFSRVTSYLDWIESNTGIFIGY